MNEVRIRAMYNIPATVRGLVREDADGNYLILVNEVLSEEAKRRVVLHELAHIHKNHFQQRYRIARNLEVELC